VIDFLELQDMLDRILGTGPAPRHGLFWRGVSRDEFVAKRVYGIQVIVVNDPAASGLVKALRGLAPFGSDLTPRPAGAVMPRMPMRRPPASEEDIVKIEEWIRGGCPDVIEGKRRRLPLTASTSDQVHVDYWRAVDHFFHPQMADPVTGEHVGRMHAGAFLVWEAAHLLNQPATQWTDFLSQPEVQASVNYLREQQNRLIGEFYGADSAAFLDSLWKFGGNLLPNDPLSNIRPRHAMNGTLDWFYWIPQLDATVRAGNLTPTDLMLLRGWQVGLVADGLLRTDAERPEGERIPIHDFMAGDPNVKADVIATFTAMDAASLLQKMQDRAHDFFAPRL
jgi:hypothetical protein